MRARNIINAQRLGSRDQSLRWAKVFLGFASLTSASWLMSSIGDESDSKKERDCDGARKRSKILQNQKFLSRAYKEAQSQMLVATSASMNPEDAQSPSSKRSQQSVASDQVKTMDYDFVVIGNGNAGLSAIRTLREKCPAAKIALVDPLRPVSSTTKKLDYWPYFATGFDPVTRTVQLSDETHQLRYRHGILVATGSRGAPPPPSLLDEEALDRVMELRPTSCLQNEERPVMSPNTVRQMTLVAASQGAAVGIMGSGWEAVELAVAAASVGAPNVKAPVLTFGSAGPLSHILPRYLSTAVTKRLRQQGVDIQPRSLVRYVASQNKKGVSKLELHTAKSYDMLDTKRTSIDLLVGK